jgi:hypothetical protein
MNIQFSRISRTLSKSWRESRGMRSSPSLSSFINSSLDMEQQTHDA